MVLLQDVAVGAPPVEVDAPLMSMSCQRSPAGNIVGASVGVKGVTYFELPAGAGASSIQMAAGNADGPVHLQHANRPRRRGLHSLRSFTGLVGCLSLGRPVSSLLFASTPVLAGMDAKPQQRTKHSPVDQVENSPGKKFKHAKGWISDIKFSPDGSRFAAGSHDRRIYLYEVNEAAAFARFRPSEHARPERRSVSSRCLPKTTSACAS